MVYAIMIPLIVTAIVMLYMILAHVSYRKLLGYKKPSPYNYNLYYFTVDKEGAYCKLEQKCYQTVQDNTKSITTEIALGDIKEDVDKIIIELQINEAKTL